MLKTKSNLLEVGNFTSEGTEAKLLKSSVESHPAS